MENKTFICFLRGINVSGKNMIKMKDLSALFQKLKFRNISTYIQSGNVVFTSSDNEESIASEVEDAIRKKFGYDVAVLVRKAGEIEKINHLNPFLPEKDFDPAKSSVIFLSEKPDKDQLSKVADVNYPPDRFKIIGKEIFIYCPNGFGRTKLYTNFFEAKMKVTGTARNWKTVTAITEIAFNFKT